MENLAQSLQPKQAMAMAKSYNVLAHSRKLKGLLETVFPEKDFSDCPKFSLHQLINDAILSNYNGELYIKQLLVNHFIEEDAIAAFEMKTNESRLDFLRINGYSISYEVKSGIDSLQKLNRQVEGYRQLFEYNYIVIDRIHLNKARQIIPDAFGIIIAENDELKYKRNARKNGQLEPETQLSLFKQAELKKFFKAPKEVVLKNYSKRQINEVFKQMLKNRYAPKWQFLKAHHSSILPVDYQYFFHHNIAPSLIYG